MLWETALQYDVKKAVRDPITLTLEKLSVPLDSRIR